ncbi:MAG: DUF1302 family protein [Cycloclasticus sp.]
MKTTKNNFNKRKSLKTAGKLITLAAAATLSSQAAAFQLDFDNREMTGYVDTTVSFSAAMALKNANPKSTASSSGRQSVFDNSGDIYSAPISVLSDIGINYKDMGFFTRVGYTYDFALMDGANACSSGSCNENAAAGTMDGIPEESREEANRFRLYDFFVYKNFDVDGRSLNVRVGKQVINWGESNFAGGGITQMINPVDLGKSTTPGSEVKERLLPQEMVYANYELSDNTSLEAFYVWNWRRTEFMPVGTFFSPFDFQGEGDNAVLGGRTNVASDNPDRGGQYGVSLHTILEDYDEMDLGFYYTRTHAHLPYMQAFNNGTYRTVYAEDQDTFAVSLNGEVGSTGISFQTELNYKPDFFDTRYCRNSHGLANGGVNVFPDTTPLAGCGIEASDVTTFLGAFTYVGGKPAFGSDKQAFIFDYAMIWIDDLNNNYSDAARPHADGVDQLDRPINHLAYGYTAVASFTYNNLFWNLNVNPVFVFKHDLEGRMPFNNGAITEEQRVVKVGVTFDYQSTMSLNIAATKWISEDGTFGDRDNVAATFKYSF